MGSGLGEPSQAMVTLGGQHAVTCLPRPVSLTFVGESPVCPRVAPGCRLPKAALCLPVLAPPTLLLSVLSVLSLPLALPLCLYQMKETRNMSHLPQGGWQKRYVNMGDLDLHLYPLE